MTEKHYIGINQLLSKVDQIYVSESISEAIQEHLCKEDELVAGHDYQINVTYETEINNSSSDLETEVTK